MQRIPFRALSALSGAPCAQLSARRGARKLTWRREKNYEELPADIELRRDRVSSIGVLLRRDPVILPEPAPFEAAYASHCDEMRLEAARPIASDFFFKKGTNDEQLFRDAQQLEKEQASASGGASNGLVSDTGDSDGAPTSNFGPENPFAPYSGQIAPRTTQADATGDIKSLDRALDKPLFLVVKKKNDSNGWRFPESPVVGTELLHEAAQRHLNENFGDIDTWVVGRVPIGFYAHDIPDKRDRSVFKGDGANVFFMKAHIMAGHVRQLKDERYEHAWLTRNELEHKEPEYFEKVKDMM